MKKYIGVISGIMFALSLGVAFAQITGGGIQIGTAPNGQTVVSGNIQTRVGSASQQPTAAQGQMVPGSSAYQQGAYQRQSQTADLSFVTNLLAQFGGIISLLPKLLIGVAVILFFWFLIKYFIIDADKEEERKKAVSGMGMSLAALFIMVALWGILAFFGNAVGINPNTTVNAPQLPR